MAAKPERNGIEWSVFALGALLTLLVVGFLVVEVFRGDGDPDLRVTVWEPRTVASGVEIGVSLLNAGDGPALDVVVEVCDARRTCGTLTFPQMPAGATREGRLSFAPGSGPLAGRVLGFRLP
jgi:hypothetical protein